MMRVRNGEHGYGVVTRGLHWLTVLLGVALARVAWRRLTPLPPWDSRLGPGGRRLLHATEVTLLATLVAMPLSGLLLVAGADDLVAVHVAAHLVFFAALAAHLGVVLGRGLLPRMLPLR